MGATALGSPTYVSTGAGVVGYRPCSATGFDFGIRHAFWQSLRATGIATTQSASSIRLTLLPSALSALK